MYSDKRKKRVYRVILTLLLAVVILCTLKILPRLKRDMTTESVTALKSAIEQSARQCYVVEGAYPPDLKYLEDNYGVKVNTNDFYITYDAFASNMAPNVIVTPKEVK